MILFSYSLKNIVKENFVSGKVFLNFSFKIDNITLDLDPDLDPNLAKILDPDPNSI